MSSADNTVRIPDISDGAVIARRLILVVLAGWTAFWAYSAVGMVRTHSKIGAGTYGATIDGHEIFELIFVASHCLARWAPLAVVLLAVWAWTGRRARTRDMRAGRTDVQPA